MVGYLGARAPGLPLVRCELVGTGAAEHRTPLSAPSLFVEYVNGLAFQTTGLRNERLSSSGSAASRPDGPAANLVARLWTNETPQVVSFGTDAPFFQKAGMDTVIFGPGGMAQMHQPDEFITEAALVEGLQFIDRLAAHMRGGH